MNAVTKGKFGVSVPKAGQGSGAGTGMIVDGLVVEVLSVDPAKSAITVQLPGTKTPFEVTVRKEKADLVRKSKSAEEPVWEGNKIDERMVKALSPNADGTPVRAIIERLFVNEKAANMTPTAYRESVMKAIGSAKKPFLADWIHSAPADPAKVRTGIISILGYRDKENGHVPTASSIIVWDEKAISISDEKAVKALMERVARTNVEERPADATMLPTTVVTMRAVKDGAVVGTDAVYSWDKEIGRLPTPEDINVYIDHARQKCPDAEIELCIGDAYRTTTVGPVHGLGYMGTTDPARGETSRGAFFVCSVLRDPNEDGYYGHYATAYGTIVLSTGKYDPKRRAIVGENKNFVNGVFIGSKGGFVLACVKGPKGEVYTIDDKAFMFEDRRMKPARDSAVAPVKTEAATVQVTDDNPFEGIGDTDGPGPK